jgi:hypothetical protein
VVTAALTEGGPRSDAGTVGGGEAVQDSCTWAIDTNEDTNERELQLILTKRDPDVEWQFLFEDEVAELNEITDTVRAARRTLWHPPCNSSRVCADQVGRAQVYMDVTIDGEAAGRVEFGLFGKAVPMTTDNFLMLCVGSLGTSPETGKELEYQGSSFHRIIPKFMIQGA